MKLLCGLVFGICFLVIGAQSQFCASCGTKKCPEAGSNCATSCGKFKDVTYCECLEGWAPTPQASCNGAAFKYYIDQNSKATPCDCSFPSGSVAESCDPVSGQCVCKEGYEGRRCDRCLKDYYSDTPPGEPRVCKACSSPCNKLQKSCTYDGGVKCTCDYNTESSSTASQCDTCTKGFLGPLDSNGKLTPAGCPIKCSDFCSTPSSINELSVPPSAGEPTCSFKPDGSVKCDECAGDDGLDPAVNCKSCKTNYYFGNKLQDNGQTEIQSQNQCRPCNCNSLGDKGTCQFNIGLSRRCDCKEGYEYSKSHGSGYGKCEECAKGYFKEADECKACPKNCATCESLTKCDTCKLSFRNQPGNTDCSVCDIGYQLVGESCVKKEQTTLTVTTKDLKFKQEELGWVKAPIQLSIQNDGDNPDYNKVKAVAFGARENDGSFLGHRIVPTVEHDGKGLFTIAYFIDGRSLAGQKTKLTGVKFEYVDSTGYTATKEVDGIAIEEALVQPVIVCPDDTTLSDKRVQDMMKREMRSPEFTSVARVGNQENSVTVIVKNKVNDGGESDSETYIVEKVSNTYHIRVQEELLLGENKFTVKITDDTAKKSASCTYTITVQTNNRPQVKCWDIPDEFSTIQGKRHAEISLPVPAHMGKVTWYRNGEKIPDIGKETSVWVGERQEIIRTVMDLEGGTDSCSYYIDVTDKEKPTCKTTGKAVLLDSQSKFRKKGDCSSVAVRVEFAAEDNSLFVYPETDNVKEFYGKEAAIAKLVATPIDGCKCDEDSTDMECATQICTVSFDCDQSPPPAVTVSTSVKDAAGNEVQCEEEVKAEAKPSISTACDYFKEYKVETEPGENYWSLERMGIDTLQRDGKVFSPFGGEVVCTTNPKSNQLVIGEHELKLQCQNSAPMFESSECDIKFVVEDKEVPEFVASEFEKICGKELENSPFKYDNDDKTKYKMDISEKITKIRDNDKLDPELEFDVWRSGKKITVESADQFPKEWEAGAYYVSIKATDQAKNQAFCAFSFRVQAGTESPTMKYKAPKIKKDVTGMPKPTNFPTQKFAAAAEAAKKINTKSCENRCNNKGQTKSVVNAAYECSCQRNVCSTAGVKCCKDIDEFCPAPTKSTAKCKAENCGTSAGTGDKKCYCDATCAAKGDCCQNFDFVKTCCTKDQVPSCKGNCRSSTPQFSCTSFAVCYCDATCSETGDCCSDYAEHC